MKLIMENWKKFVNEEYGSYTGATAGDVEWGLSKHEFREFHRRDDVGGTDDIELVQAAVGPDFLVIDPMDNEQFRVHVEGREPGPNGEEIIVPLTTVEVDGNRINYFKTAHSHKYGRLVS